MIPDIKKILYATDLSQNSAHAFVMPYTFQKNSMLRSSFYMLSEKFLKMPELYSRPISIRNGAMSLQLKKEFRLSIELTNA